MLLIGNKEVCRNEVVGCGCWEVVVVGSDSLDSYPHNSTSVTRRDCFKSHGTRTLFKRDRHGAHFIRAGCKAWNCPRCGPCKVKRWVKAVRREVCQWPLINYASLTMNHSGYIGRPFVNQNKDAMKVWGRFARILNKKFAGVSWIMAKEPQPKSGVWSCNVLLDRNVDQRWLSETWEKCGGGKIVWIKRADENVPSYLAKYFTKFWLNLPPSFKRYCTSRGIGLCASIKGESEWKLLEEPIWVLRARVGEVIKERSDERGLLYFQCPPIEGEAFDEVPF